MGFFDLFRDKPYPTLYGTRKTPVTADVLVWGLGYAIFALAFSLMVIAPGIRGRERLFYGVRTAVAVFVLGSILLVNFGQEWDVAELSDVPIQYRAGLDEEIVADIGLKISLRNINITLKTNPEEQSFRNGTVRERINYNERFSWDNEGWVQGRMGFGPYAGLFNQEYRAAQEKGLPYPILWIAEYFTLDGEWIRWGRFYRQAGYYTHFMIWLAFALWLLSIITFKMVPEYGAVFSFLTGVCLLIANFIYGFLRNPNELEIPLTAEKKLNPRFGWCFWLCAFNGILTTIIGVVVMLLECFWKSERLLIFFNTDAKYDEVYEGGSEVPSFALKGADYALEHIRQASDVENNAVEQVNPVDENGGVINPNAGQVKRHFRKRTIVRSADQHLVLQPKSSNHQQAEHRRPRDDNNESRPHYRTERAGNSHEEITLDM